MKYEKKNRREERHLDVFLFFNSKNPALETMKHKGTKTFRGMNVSLFNST